VTPHLTISAGVRWEVAQPLLDKTGKEVNTQLNQALPFTANVTDPSKRPVLVRAGNGNFTTIWRSVILPISLAR